MFTRRGFCKLLGLSGGIPLVRPRNEKRPRLVELLEVPAAVADQSVTLRAGIAALHAEAPPWERLVLRVWLEV